MIHHVFKYNTLEPLRTELWLYIPLLPQPQTLISGVGPFSVLSRFLNFCLQPCSLHTKSNTKRQRAFHLPWPISQGSVRNIL